jgi:acetoin utilization deacetylase AcuC-like enzyme
MAEELCKGRIGFVMEGGYDLDAISHGLLNVAYALLGKDTVSDPLGDLDMPQQGADGLVDQLIALHKLS